MFSNNGQSSLSFPSLLQELCSRGRADAKRLMLGVAVALRQGKFAIQWRSLSLARYGNELLALHNAVNCCADPHQTIMVNPVTGEAEWLPVIRRASLWTPTAGTAAWVIAPHPDDETLAAGGLISRLTGVGARVHVIAVTDGENAYRENAGLAALRICEQEEALNRLGVQPGSTHRLHLVDSGLAGTEEQLRIAFAALITPGSFVLAPWTGDFHPDHEVCGRAALAACQDVGATCVCYFFWTWHRGRPELLAAEDLYVVELTSEERQAKVQALSSHRSQLAPCGEEPPILPENLLWPARMAVEVYLR